MIKKETLQKLYYNKKLSMWDIAGVLSVTPATVVYWMKKYGMKRRSSNDAAYAKQNPDGDPFRIKNRLTAKDRELLLSGLMLYWGEGSRRNKHVVQMANLDSRLLELFVRFLRKICSVKKNKLCLTVQLYKRFSSKWTKNYWSRKLNIPKAFIAVNVHSDKRSKPDNQWSEYGIARIEVRNVKLKRWIDNALERQITKWN